MPIPPEFANFDVAHSHVTVWLFRKSGGAAGSTPTFTGRWVSTSDELDAALREAVAAQRDSIEEVNEYSLLAQNNEASALSIGTLETHADLLLEKTANPLPQRMVKSLRDIQNTHFYVIKLVQGDQSLLGVRKTDSSWRSRKRRGRLDAIFNNEGLSLDERPMFSLSKYVDFFVLGESIYILDKSNFESVLSYRQAHAQDFTALQAEPEFGAIFSDLAPLVEFVGSNRIQLRRACAIRQKGHYRDQNFLQRLRQNYANAHLDLQFDQAGLLVPTAANCSDIITALLDHRLLSAFSQNVYNVPDATKVN